MMKEAIFRDSAGFAHITPKRILEKTANLQKAYKKAKMMQDQSGFGLHEQDNDHTVNGAGAEKFSVMFC